VKNWAYVIGVGLMVGACSGPAPESAAATAESVAAGTTGAPATTAVAGTANAAVPAATAGAAAAKASAPRPVAAEPPRPQFAEITIPAGTTLHLELTSAVASDTSKVEQPVNAALVDAVMVDGKVVVAAGAELAGVVTEVERPGRVKGLARVAYRFDSMRAGDATYQIETAPVSHTADSTKGDDAKKVAIGAGVGAAIGAIAGGGSGAAKGAAIGAGSGAGLVLATRGDDVKVAAGTPITAKLTAPMTVRVRL